MNLRNPLTALFAFAALQAPLAAQEAPPALDHDDALAWRSIAQPQLSPDGRWVAYALTPYEGDPVLVVRSVEGSEEARIRGAAPVFTSGSKFLVFRIPPADAVLDSLKMEGSKGSDLPKDTLAYFVLDEIGAGGGEARRAGEVKSWKAAPTGAWAAFQPTEEPEAEDAEGEEGEEGAEEEAPAEGGPGRGAGASKEAGSSLIALSLESGARFRYEFATEYVFAEESETLAFAASSTDGAADGVTVLALDEEGPRSFAVASGEGRYAQLALSRDGTQVAFLSDRADRGEEGSEDGEFSVYHASAPGFEAAARASSASEALPDGWTVSEHGDIAFSKDGQELRFGTAPRQESEPEDGVLDEDRVRLDIWNWKDPYLQPMQLRQLERERNRSYLAIVHLEDGRVVQLGSEDVPGIRPPAEGGGWYLGTSDLLYRQLVSWDGRYSDLYAVDARTGAKRRIAEKTKGFAALSPTGRYAHWWDGDAKRWIVADMESGKTRAVGEEVGQPLWNELSDDPDIPPPYGAAGWTKGEEALLFYDRFDVWRFEPETGEVQSVTAGRGRATGVRYRLARMDPEDPFAPEGEAVWEAFHLSNKASGFHKGRTDRPAAPTPLLMEDKRFRLRGKAKDADRWLVTREDFREFPDLWATGPDFENLLRLSDANPQQAEARWGSAELVSWISNDGAPLQGILVKPDGFDESRDYPMMVYFYERMSDGLHQYRSPRPGGSSISVSFYASRGYVVFIPDIPYEVGYPGESALDAVVPGVLSILAEGYVDPKRVGVQGHSWGGYQIAYMITKTDLFAAAEAGAPVSNMTSAYGGIRWATGMSRMFQYERTQSRIGATLWDATAEYLHNSPLFFADKIRTPLLMLHNDEDGAVPWYQGIEMFVAMRRLGKPVWMLNYNGEAHGLRRAANQKDWAVRMQQFFDHYLKDAPAPVWLEEGVPALEKGKTLGLEIRSGGVS